MVRALQYSCFCVWLIVGYTAPALADDSGKARALVLFADSDKAYKTGNFERSVVLLREAYALYPEPILIYNLARALQELGDQKAAIETYERYLAEAKQIEDRGAIERRVATLKQQLAAQHEPSPREPAGASPVTAAEPRTRVERPVPPSPSKLPWITIAVGSAIAASGAAFAYLASDLHDRAASNSVQADANKQNDRAKTFAMAANIQLVAGGAVVIGGILWKIVDRPTKRDDVVRVHVGPSSVGIAGTW